jgi:hypothetical protein
MIDEGGKKAINVVISENRFLEIVFEFCRIVIKLLVIMTVCVSFDGTYEFLVKQAEIARCQNGVGLLIADEASMSAKVFFFSLKLENHVKSIDVAATVHYKEI